MNDDEIKFDAIFLLSLGLFFYGLYKVGEVSTNKNQETVAMGIRG
jgi:hypothetical protein